LNRTCFITTFGEVRKINTTGSIQGETWLDGDVLWLSETTAGQLTNIEPNTHPVQIGYVIYAHANNGKIFVSVSEGVDQLNELHDVAITSVANNDILQYDSATSLWKNESLSSAGIQPSITLTTTGTSGAATLVGSTLNIPQYGGGGGASIIKLTLQTLVSASWVLVGSYYTYTFSNVNITTNTRVDFTPENGSYSEVSVCGLLPQVDVAAGSCTFYSLFPPSTDIRGEITIIPTI
jgi:hypothetical protein